MAERDIDRAARIAAKRADDAREYAERLPPSPQKGHAVRDAIDAAEAAHQAAAAARRADDEDDDEDDD